MTAGCFIWLIHFYLVGCCCWCCVALESPPTSGRQIRRLEGVYQFWDTRMYAIPVPNWPPRHGTCWHVVHGHQSYKNRHSATDSNIIALWTYLPFGWFKDGTLLRFWTIGGARNSEHRGVKIPVSTKTVFILQDFAAVRASIWLLNKIFKYQRSNGHDQMTKYLFLAQWHDSPTKHRKDLRHRIRARRTDSS